jgi:diguanylate cyclase (GGDEF)-like protein
VSGAQSVSVYAESASGNPVFLTEGEPLLPEHANLRRAREFADSSRELVGERAQLESAVSGWLAPVPCVPYGRSSQIDERRKAAAGDELRHCWIGLRFEESGEGRSKSHEAFERLRGLSTTGPDTDRWSSLLGLGGVLSWYALQISSILDDPVTGLAGRTEFQARLGQACEEAKSTGRPLSLLFANPDHFTSVNERFGHDAGDRVLREIGERLRATQRSSDSIAKYGGAIFASFLTETDLDSARIVAEKVWTSLSSATYLDETLRLGVSLGVAVFDPGDPAFGGHLELIRRADKALTAAKRLGGGHIVCWEPELESKDLGNVDRMTGVYTGNMAKDYRNMTLLSDTMTVVAGSADIEELAEQVVERLFLTLKADHVGVFEWDEKGTPVLLDGMSKRASSNGRGVEPTNRLTLGHRQIALIEDAFRERKPIIVSFSDEYSDRKVLSFAVPLVLGDACLGCLYIDGREDSISLEGASDLGFLRAFATQLAVALDRARRSERHKRVQEREHFRLRAEVDDLRRALQHSKLSYRSPEMDSVLQTVRRVAPTKATVLVIGESGTGKELVARTIHELSPFRTKPIVVVDCGAIPMTLIESELFGHERGAYTGAQERRIGRVLEAEGGTVVLDEIGELPLEVQSKLLRFVQERQVVPVGGTRVRHVDTRLIAVTNRELSVEAAAGRFREDLYYRLNVVRVTVPPLRERVDDILHLANHFLEHFAEQYQKAPLQFTEAALAGMLEHHWPGNVRELQNRIMQAVILSEGPEINVRELELEQGSPEQTREMERRLRSKRGKRFVSPSAARWKSPWRTPGASHCHSAHGSSRISFSKPIAPREASPAGPGLFWEFPKRRFAGNFRKRRPRSAPGS